MSDAPIIEAKGLNLWYGPNHALKDISVAVPAHEITAFIGPSGCCLLYTSDAADE